ncbi:MAG: hypothetical protein HC917_21145 [Richelia sp. SM2_1_7]|nr:hypothetical protein [Richelia sp. SM2_1_7]
MKKKICIQNQNLDSSFESNTGNSSIFESQNIKNSTCLLPEIVANGKKNGISAYQTLREAGYICTDKETIFRQDVVI